MSTTPTTISDAGYKVLNHLPGRTGQDVFLCAKANGRQPFRIIVVQDDSIVGLFPDNKSCEIIVYNQNQLHRGKYLLFENLRSNATKCFLPALNLESLTVEPKYFAPQINEMAVVIGADVDDTGRYTVIGTCWDDFPEIVIHDSDGDEFIAIDCRDLIDLPIENIRWKNAPEHIIGTDEYTQDDINVRIDLENRKSHFENA